MLYSLNYLSNEAKTRWILSDLDVQATNARITTLQAPSAAFYNSLAYPDTIVPEDHDQPIESLGQFEITVPPHSVTHVILQ